MTDLVVRGARIVGEHADGPSAPMDIVCVAGRIAAVSPAGSSRRTEATVVDADGRLAVPGFVDAHVHAESSIFEPDVALAMLRQGITTVVLGQDGVSFAPSPAEAEHDAFRYATTYFDAVNGAHPTFTGGSVADLLSTYHRTIPVNVAYLAPHGTIRYAVMGADTRSARDDEIAAMAALLAQALTDGACGMSTGLEYTPGGAADRRELIALTRVLAEHRLPHVSHMRGYETHAVESLAELLDLAGVTGVATHVSHLHGPAEEIIAAVDAARADGHDLTFDAYPYLRAASIVSMVALPTWFPSADPGRALALLRDGATLERLHREHFSHCGDLWPRMTISAAPGRLSWAEGLTVPVLAERLNRSPGDAVVELLLATGLRAGCVFAQPPTNSEESVRALIAHPAHLAGSDAIHQGSVPHPRGWGAIARLLRVWVGEYGDWTWPQAVGHLSGAAARRFALPDREKGSLEPGAAADIALIDPAAVTDRADYAAPRVPAAGIDDVVVGGVAVLAQGSLTGATPGRALSPRQPHTRL